ncbi:hypothetical protein P0L94_07465 [Microbacter sp. GSS18]|nr:hypothetical protein P0L94_07465 [Microbacter sp. GSS18]
MDALPLFAAAVDGVPEHSVNLWGSLGCAVAYSASLLTTLDAFADFVSAKGDSMGGALAPGMGLRFWSKIAGATIAVIAAAIVLALDLNWFAFWSLSAAYVVVIGIGLAVVYRQTRGDAFRRFG